MNGLIWNRAFSQDFYGFSEYLDNNLMLLGRKPPWQISSQRKILQKAAKDKGYTDTIFFVDDGITGTTMKRPGFQKMLTAIEAGYISAVFVKDLSRLGRNYIEVGKLTEEFFPLHDIRLVAVSDGVDSNEGEDDFTPFKNIMNDNLA